MTRGYGHIKIIVASASVTLWVEYEEMLVSVLYKHYLLNMH